MPKEGLSIEGGELRYGMDDLINLTCIAHPSNPVQTLKWFINDVEVSRMRGDDEERMREADEKRAQVL